ncbi:MAG: two pore domain potassium channel family protein [Chromatiales bacterium]|nr:MAG: two pore domain potassium channel family protein [Chromatiales bacterium]
MRGKRRVTRRAVRLRVAHAPRLGGYLRSVIEETYFLRFIVLLGGLWLLFAAAIFLAEQGVEGAPIQTFGQALYWGVAALSTAGIADTPVSGAAQAIGAAWILIGSVLFFGIIVASITGYFMRPVQRPARQIIDTIEYNLEHLADLSVDELDLLKRTTDNLILHMERMKQREAGS